MKSRLKSNNKNFKKAPTFDKSVHDEILELLRALPGKNIDKLEKLSNEINESMAKNKDYCLLRLAIVNQHEFMVDKILEKIDSIEEIGFDSPIRLATERKSHNIFKKVIKKSASDNIFEAFLYSLLTDIKIHIDDFFDNIDFENKENLKK